MVLVPLIIGRVGEPFSLQPIYRQPPSTKGTSHLLLTLGHHEKQGATRYLFLLSQSHTPDRAGGGKGKKADTQSSERVRFMMLVHKTSTFAHQQHFSCFSVLSLGNRPPELKCQRLVHSTADKRESLWNFKTLKSPTRKESTLLALGRTISLHKFPQKTKPKCTFF